ncbi:zinc finger protein, putative [Babesia caballi]|uniref:Zinc finger protein, putative n=1 Tax=Babesia caballi TaxID=5871 RepID=A0AAV4LV88_BABCB|nr:zinc finger protein, putative [Babesia caballi]
MEDRVVADVGGYSDTYNRAPTFSKLSDTLGVLTDDAVATGPLPSPTISESSDDYYTSLRDYIDRLSVDEVDATIRDVLESMSIRGEAKSTVQATQPGLPLSTEDLSVSNNTTAKWQPLFCRFEPGQSQSTVSSDILKRPTGLQSDSLRTGAPLAPMYTFYDDSSYSECVSTGWNPNISTFDASMWDFLASSHGHNGTKGSYLANVRGSNGTSLADSLINTQADAFRVEQALASALSETYTPESHHSRHPKSAKAAKHNRVQQEGSQKTPTSGLVNVKLNAANEFWRTSICKYWQRGICENTDCNFAHGKKELKATVGVWKTTLCHHWKNGTCRVGKDCRHAHGEAELQPKNIPLLVLKNKFLNTVRRREPGRRKKGAKNTSLIDLADMQASGVHTASHSPNPFTVGAGFGAV